jgi:glycosyltransferase involved in cell wall biosynthesis
VKVLMISGSYPPIDCGIKIHTSKLARTLLHQQPSLQLKILTSTAAERDDLSLPRVASWTSPALRPVNETMREIKPDLIHIEYPSVMYRRHVFINLLPWWLRLRFPRVPIVLTVHEYHDASWLGKLRILLTLLPVQRTVISNQEDADSLAKVVPFKRVDTIPISPSFEPYRFTAKELTEFRRAHHLADSRAVVYFGTVEPKKGVKQLLDSVAAWPKGTKLVIGARFKPYEPYHRDLAQQIKSMPGLVEWIDYPSDRDVSALLQLADVAALPYNQPASLRRSTMLATLDHGCPTIVTGPVRPPLAHEVNCFVIQPNTADQIAQAVTRLLSEPNLAKLLTVNGRKLAHNFSWSQVAKQYYAIYEELAH